MPFFSWHLPNGCEPRRVDTRNAHCFSAHVFFNQRKKCVTSSPCLWIMQNFAMNCCQPGVVGSNSFLMDVKRLWCEKWIWVEGVEKVDWLRLTLSASCKDRLWTTENIERWQNSWKLSKLLFEFSLVVVLHPKFVFHAVGVCGLSYRC